MRADSGVARGLHLSISRDLQALPSFHRITSMRRSLTQVQLSSSAVELLKFPRCIVQYRVTKTPDGELQQLVLQKQVSPEYDGELLDLHPAFKYGQRCTISLSVLTVSCYNTNDSLSPSGYLFPCQRRMPFKLHLTIKRHFSYGWLMTGQRNARQHRHHPK